MAQMSQLSKDVFAGAGVGLLLGTIVGLSSSPVTATVVAALSAGLLALIGFRKSDAESPEQPTNMRVGAFGFACVAGLLFGVFARAHSVLSPSLTAEQARWTSIGLKSDQAAKVVPFEETGIKFDNSIQASTPGGTHSSVSFANSESGPSCDVLDSARYSSLNEQLNAMGINGGPIAQFGEAISTLNPKSQRQAISALHDLCVGHSK
jgi:hypothetical protein